MRLSKWLKWIIGGAIILAVAIILENVRDSGEIGVAFWMQLPTWEIVRVTGLISYFLLFLGISLGIIYGMPIWKGKEKANIYQLHSITMIIGVFCGILHPMFLVIDRYVTFSWSELLIPFSSTHNPFLAGLGTVTVYSMLLIILTTDMRSKISQKVWHALHMCAYPIYLIALTHGMFGGTDTKNIWIFLMYIVTFLILLILMIIQVRMITSRKAHLPSTSR